ncbi:MAG: hypothetical protein KGM16_14275 [Bacteroidota bacterium]|nr:hypothetical protein [Bacteroidota bacterium]
MKLSKLLAGGIIDAVIYFLLGYLFYGVLLNSFFARNGMATDMSKFTWWAMILSTVASGFLIAYVLSVAGATTMGKGFAIGFVVGLLMELSIDLGMYGMGQSMMDSSAIAVDAVITAVISGLAGLATGMVYGSGKKAAA